MAAGPDLRHPELPRIGRLDRAPEPDSHGLHAVADPEHRHPGPEHGLRDRETVSPGDRLRSPGEHDALRRERFERVVGDVERTDLAVHARLADAPGDEPRVLRPEVEDEDASGADVGGRRHGCRRSASNGHGRAHRSSGGIVRSFARDAHVVRVPFAKPGR